MKKQSVKSRILAIFLACMAVVCMAIPTFAASTAPRTPARGTWSDGMGGTIYCPGIHVSHIDTDTWKDGGKVHHQEVEHHKENGQWVRDYLG